MPPPGNDMGLTSRQSGQVLVLGMVLAAALSLAWLRYFATGQVVAGKARLIHGLDAAAYSGALVQARTLNFLAYVNRAQMAHQLAMAHLLTLGSWAHFGGTQAGRLAQGNPPAYLIGMLFGADHGRAYLSAANAVGLDVQAGPEGDLGRAWAAHDAFVHGHLRDLAGTLVQRLPEARLAAMQAVLAEHYPEHAAPDLRPQVVSDAWPGLVHSGRPDSTLLDFTRRLAGLYPFLAPRNRTARNGWPVDARCPGLRHELRRRGATELDERGHWRSGDTQSFHAVRSNRWIGCYYREYAMGWAWMPSAGGQSVGDHAEDAPENFAEQDFWRWVRSATQWDLVGGDANPLANSYAARARRMWPSQGLAAYETLSTEDPYSAAAPFVVSLSASGAEGQALHARSAAESYFSRPARRADGRLEIAHLFLPYWHARLSAERAP
ncbi:hypothetical protein CDEF62S_05916 [Castellaniella defragrans]